ncbi:MAG: hypothetical protein Q8M99_09655 [Methylotenera sp.]|nr:hypothetical protein [Methylotenera sp.]
MSSAPPNIPDRRNNMEIRDIFVSACEILAPIISSNAKVLTVSAFGMARMLQDRFPTLTASQVQIVIATAEKLYFEKRLQSLLNKNT